MITVGSILAMLLPLNAFVSAGILPQLSQLIMPDFNNSGYSTLPDVQTFAALGDSFATGMGAGKMLGIPIFSGHWWCSRYGNSYGSLVFNDMPRPKATRKFHNYACSGHNIDTITKKQLPQLKNGNYDAITLSVGGNNVGFTSLVNNCVFAFMPRKDVPANDTRSGCFFTLDETSEKIDKLEESGDMVRLLQQTRQKLQKDTGRLYLTGYPQLVHPNSTKCNNVDFALHWGFMELFFGEKGSSAKKRYLTVEIRQRIHDMIVKLNKALESAVEKAGDQIVFVPVAQHFIDCHGRSCEEIGQEPAYDSWSLMHFMPGSHDNTGKKAGPLFEAEFGEIRTASSHSVSPPSGGVTTSGLSFWLPNNVLRLLHPKSTGHRVIADLVLSSMANEKAMMEGKMVPMPGEEICPINREWWKGPEVLEL